MFRFKTTQKEFQWILPRFYSCVDSIVLITAFWSHHGLIMPVPVLKSSLPSVKAANKKAEKNKKTTATTPNLAEEGQYRPVTEGERARRFSVSQEISWTLWCSKKWFFFFSEGTSACFRWQHCVWFPWGRICGTKLRLFSSLPVLSCQWQINPKLGSFRQADIPFNRLIHTIWRRRQRWTTKWIRCWEDPSLAIIVLLRKEQTFGLFL